MKVRHEQLQALAGITDPDPSLPVPPEIEARSLGQASPQGSSATSVAKMLSTELGYGMLVKATLEGEEGAQERFFFFKGSTLAWNQILAKGSAGCLETSLIETGAVTKFADQFLWKTRVTTTDAYSANNVCEKMMLQRRGPATLEGATWSILPKASLLRCV